MLLTNNSYYKTSPVQYNKSLSLLDTVWLDIDHYFNFALTATPTDWDAAEDFQTSLQLTNSSFLNIFSRKQYDHLRKTVTFLVNCDSLVFYS